MDVIIHDSCYNSIQKILLFIHTGQWLDNLGIGEANNLIGRPDSIAVRMPDNAVTSYLVDQTGPIAVSSANPTGEADCTHHLQVLAKLGLENVRDLLLTLKQIRFYNLFSLILCDKIRLSLIAQH